MCGIMGFLSDGRPEQTRAAVCDMMASSRHRGPDASGSLEIPFAESRLVLGHTRLSIIDLSDGSRQPMQDAKSGSCLAYNGEIYNFRQLRTELEALGMMFVTPGDSEVLLKALVQWGEQALEKLEGMFAFAFWDGRSRSLLLARDRMGMKPLYYYSGPRGFAFASEVKVLEKAQICPLTLDRDAVDSFLAYGAVIGPNTIFREIRELEPGHLLRVNARGEVAASEYWSLTGCLAISERDEIRDFDHAVGHIKERLEAAVNSHLVSDVPVGVFLGRRGLEFAGATGGTICEKPHHSANGCVPRAGIFRVTLCAPDCSRPPASPRSGDAHSGTAQGLASRCVERDGPADSRRDQYIRDFTGGRFSRIEGAADGNWRRRVVWRVHDVHQRSQAAAVRSGAASGGASAFQV